MARNPTTPVTKTSTPPWSNLRGVGVPALTDLIRRFSEDGRPVSCVVGNPFIPWVLDVAADMGILGAVLWVQSCVIFSTYYHFHHSLAEFPSVAHPDVQSVTLPGIPTLRPEDLPSFLLPSNARPRFVGVLRDALWLELHPRGTDVGSAGGGVSPVGGPIAGRQVLGRCLSGRSTTAGASKAGGAGEVRGGGDDGAGGRGEDEAWQESSRKALTEGGLSQIRGLQLRLQPLA